MKVLVSNDDGVFSPGIYALAYAMSKIAEEVLIVAPDIEQSASGHALTLRRPLRYKRTNLKNLPDNVSAFRVDGTPADCVMLGVHNGGEPDVVVSGINIGSNLGFDITSSGTVAAALEGCSMNIPSIAFSLKLSDELDFSHGAAYAAELVPQVVKTGLPEQTLLNVNFPVGKPKGVRTAKQSTHMWEDYYVERQDPYGKPYYWLAGNVRDHDDPGTDFSAVKAGYTAVTPLQLSMTNTSFMNALSDVVPGLDE